MEQINKLGSVVYYTRKLVNIDINSIREIPSLSDFREVITESLTHLYRFYGEEDFIHLIDEIYQYEEEQHNKNKEFYNSLTLKEDKHYRDEEGDSIACIE